MRSDVISQQVLEAIDRRQVLYALFTTFTFEPEFFELEVLPLFFDSIFSQEPNVRRAQLSSAMRGVHCTEVYYDETVFAPDGSAKLDFLRIPIRHRTGAFHPKLSFLLVEDDQGQQALIVAAGSNNLTRSGWWEKIECAYVTEIREAVDQDFRDALAAMLDAIGAVDRACDDPAVDRPAWSAVRGFLLDLPVEDHQSSKGLYFYDAAESFDAFLENRIGKRKAPWTLEIISPFFVENSNDRLHSRLMRRLNVGELLLFLPCNEKAEALCDGDYYKNLACEKNVHWCEFAKGLKGRLGLNGNTYRGLHAKVFRFTSRVLKEEWVFVGSVNFTNKAFGGREAANVEAGVLIKMAKPVYTPLLEMLNPEPEPEFVPVEKLEQEPGEQTESFPWMAIRYDWAQKQLTLKADSNRDLECEILGNDNTVLGRFSLPANAGQWIAATLSDKPVGRIEKVLRTTSFVRACVSVTGVDQKLEKRIMVQETGMSQKPSLVASLTPRQILELWSTMDPEARLQLIAQHKLAPISIIEYLPEYADQEAVQADESFFSKFSQVFQAFGKLEAHLDKALEQGNLKDFEYYFLGREVDSLRSFLRSVNQSEHFEKMPVVTYIIGLCARQLQEKYTAPDMAAAESIAAMIDQNQLAYADLLGLVNTLLAVKERLDLSAEMAGKNEPFFAWFEGAFLKHFQPVATK